MAARRKSLPVEPERRRGRPPGSTSDATRARILSAARDCFAQAGYAETTNRQIADRAGITAAAIYQYFDSKTALYMATARDAQQELLPRFREAVAGAPTARAALSALVRASAGLHEKDRSLAPFLSAMPVEMARHAEIAAAMAEDGSEVLEIVQGVVDRAVRGGEIAAADGPAVVSMFLACTMGLSLYAASIGGGELGEAVGAFALLLEGSLIGAPKAGGAKRITRPGRSRR